MKFICKNRNYFADRLWQPGDTADFGPQDAGAPSVVAHFSLAEADPAEAPAVVVPVVEAVAVDAVEEAEHSSAKDNLKALCLRNGIKVVARTTMAQMREALAEKGVVVN
jgi:hypothetical protein